MKSIRIQYTLRPDVDLDEYKRELAAFVAGIGAQNARHRYQAFQQVGHERELVHFGEFVESELPALQAAPFFKRFTALLRERCATGPEVTPLTPVASTSG